MRPSERRRLDADGEEARRDPGEGRAPVLLREADARVRQGALPGLHKNKQRIALVLGFPNLLIAERRLAG